MSKVRVLYDSQAFDMQTHGGVSRCFVELIRRMPADVETRLSAVETDNVYLEDRKLNPVGDTYRRFLHVPDCLLKWFLYKVYYNIRLGNWKDITCPPKLNLLCLKRDFKRWDFDVFHPTFFIPTFMRLVRKSGKPFVLTVHDMIPELYPQYFDPEAMHLQHKRDTIAAADHIVAVSRQTKNDLMRIAGVPEDRITVIYHGADESVYVPTSGFVKEQFGREDFRYVLFVGARGLYKNFAAFVRGMVPLLKEDAGLNIVCTGAPFCEDELVMLDELGVRDRVRQVFARDDQHMSDLYHYSVCFVYPSDYEGFGIPILEAWRAECPVVLNDIAVFREVAENAAQYVHMDKDGGDVAAVVGHVCRMSAEEKSRLLEVQRERLSCFSWKVAAEKLAEVYRAVAGRK